jgi:RNA polymerase sigma-70 factor, ECF subfamily
MCTAAYLADEDRPFDHLLFESSLGPCRRLLYPTALRMTGNSSDAEDLVQDTMSRAYAGLAGFTPGSNGRAWLFRIMANTFVNTYRKSRREPPQVPSADADIAYFAATRLVVDVAAQSASAAEDEVLCEFSHSEIHQAMAELPAGFRAAIYLVDIEGYSYRDAAELLCVPIGTVMSRLHRARKRLKEHLCAGLGSGPDN